MAMGLCSILQASLYLIRHQWPLSLYSDKCRAVASDTRGPLFESSHRQFFYRLIVYSHLYLTDKNKEKEAEMAHLKNNCLPNTSDGYHIQSILSFFLESFQIVSKVEPKLTTFLRSRKGLGLLLGLDKSILLKRLKFLEEKKERKEEEMDTKVGKKSLTDARIVFT